MLICSDRRSSNHSLLYPNFQHNNSHPAGQMKIEVGYRSSIDPQWAHLLNPRCGVASEVAQTSSPEAADHTTFPHHHDLQRMTIFLMTNNSRHNFFIPDKFRRIYPLLKEPRPKTSHVVEHKSSCLDCLVRMTQELWRRRMQVYKHGRVSRTPPQNKLQ